MLKNEVFESVGMIAKGIECAADLRKESCDMKVANAGSSESVVVDLKVASASDSESASNSEKDMNRVWFLRVYVDDDGNVLAYCLLGELCAISELVYPNQILRMHDVKFINGIVDPVSRTIKVDEDVERVVQKKLPVARKSISKPCAQYCLVAGLSDGAERFIFIFRNYSNGKCLKMSYENILTDTGFSGAGWTALVDGITVDKFGFPRPDKNVIKDDYKYYVLDVNYYCISYSSVRAFYFND